MGKILFPKPNLHSGGPLKIGCQLHGLRNILHMLKIMKPTPGTDLWGPEISLEALRHSFNAYHTVFALRRQMVHVDCVCQDSLNLLS